jgi:hypothetical protein
MAALVPYDTATLAGFTADDRVGAFLKKSDPYDDFTLRMSDPPGNRALLVDFRAPRNIPPCTSKGTCRKNFSFAWITDIPYGGALVRPLAPSGDPLTGGMRAIPVGAEVFANLKINFPDPSGRSLVWTVRFNPRDYPGSSPVRVTRSASSEWVAEAGDTEFANLVQSKDGSVRGQVGEGLYSMPFRLTITLP